jgi:hypothetical protein
MISTDKKDFSGEKNGPSSVDREEEGRGGEGGVLKMGETAKFLQ